jgi:hypothetical protein
MSIEPTHDRTHRRRPLPHPSSAAQATLARRVLSLLARLPLPGHGHKTPRELLGLARPAPACLWPGHLRCVRLQKHSLLALSPFSGVNLDTRLILTDRPTHTHQTNRAAPPTTRRLPAAIFWPCDHHAQVPHERRDWAQGLHEPRRGRNANVYPWGRKVGVFCVFRGAHRRIVGPVGCLFCPNHIRSSLPPHSPAPVH